MIEAAVEEELDEALGAGKSQRVGTARTGYRHGAREGQLSTSVGKTTIMLTCARLKDADGAESEWHSWTIRRYPRRTARVDAALLGTYLSGIKTRRLRGALSPAVTRSAFMNGMRYRVWSGGCVMFIAWSTRDLAAEEVC
jgi:transposase-like protein